MSRSHTHPGTRLRRLPALLGIAALGLTTTLPAQSPTPERALLGRTEISWHASGCELRYPRASAPIEGRQALLGLRAADDSFAGSPPVGEATPLDSRWPDGAAALLGRRPAPHTLPAAVAASLASPAAAC